MLVLLKYCCLLLLGALTTDNNNNKISIWLFLLLYIVYISVKYMEI